VIWMLLVVLFTEEDCGATDDELKLVTGILLEVEFEFVTNMLLVVLFDEDVTGATEDELNLELVIGILEVEFDWVIEILLAVLFAEDDTGCTDDEFELVIGMLLELNLADDVIGMLDIAVEFTLDDGDNRADDVTRAASVEFRLEGAALTVAL